MLRSTYHVFDLYVNHLGDTVVDLWCEAVLPTMTITHKQGHSITIESLDLLATTFSDKPGMAIAAVNKDPENLCTITLPLSECSQVILYTVNGESKDSYNDVGHDSVTTQRYDLGQYENHIRITLEPHSVNLIELIPV